MASLSRGLGWPCLKLKVLGPSRAAATSSRLLTTGRCLRAAATQRSPSQARRSAAAAIAASQGAADGKTAMVAKAAKAAKADTVAKAATLVAQPKTPYWHLKSYTAKTTPTVLYEAPSHFWYYFGCWTSGGSILAWTLLTSRIVLVQPEGVPQWVSSVYGISYMILAGMGFFLITRTLNVVNTIEMLPGASVGSAKKSDTKFSALRIQITVRRMLPFFRPKVVTTTLDNVSLRSRFSLPTKHVPELQRQREQRQEEEERQKLKRFDMAHLLTMPFRRIGRAFKALFRGVRSAWTNSGFAFIVADGKQYKVDITQGYALDGFRELERLVPVCAKDA
ncbi:hypothetical protein CDD81_4090 [Ophiocordyceps australis]|uniref:Uncharacterized protein n=1 Tax=Ophiocordyceps australis TaxID=1399860 RepID=A0A2C5XAH6_9HYPO|nr:hypothetical protein CDD81_4090 [Ophiocordyceps australis]